MSAKDIRILSEGHAQVVEFIGEGTEVVSVRLGKRAESDQDAITQAKALLHRLGGSDATASAGGKAEVGSPRESLEAEQRDQGEGSASRDLDTALKDTFPASDPLSSSSGTVSIDHRRTA